MGGMLFPWFSGRLLDQFKASTGDVTGGYTILFGICASAYLLAFVVHHLLAPKLEPVAAKGGTGGRDAARRDRRGRQHQRDARPGGGRHPGRADRGRVRGQPCEGGGVGPASRRSGLRRLRRVPRAPADGPGGDRQPVGPARGPGDRRGSPRPPRPRREAARHHGRGCGRPDRCRGAGGRPAGSLLPGPLQAGHRPPETDRRRRPPGTACCSSMPGCPGTGRRSTMVRRGGAARGRSTAGAR